MQGSLAIRYSGPSVACQANVALPEVPDRNDDLGSIRGILLSAALGAGFWSVVVGVWFA